MPLTLITMSSANSVPRMTSLSKPVPPSTETGRVHVVRDLVLAAAGADVERAAGREAEADDRPRDAVGVERDDVVLPLRRVGVGGERRRAGDVRVGLVADVVVVVVLAEAGPPLAVVARVLGGVADAVVVRVDRVQARVGVGLEVDVVEVAVAVAVGARVADGGERERADDEEVVVVVALEPELGLVRVDGELVVAGAAGRDERRVDARAQPAARGRDRATGNVSCAQQRALGRRRA